MQNIYVYNKDIRWGEKEKSPEKAVLVVLCVSKIRLPSLTPLSVLVGKWPRMSRPVLSESSLLKFRNIPLATAAASPHFCPSAKYIVSVANSLQFREHCSRRSSSQSEWQPQNSRPWTFFACTKLRCYWCVIVLLADIKIGKCFRNWKWHCCWKATLLENPPPGPPARGLFKKGLLQNACRLSRLLLQVFVIMH